MKNSKGFTLAEMLGVIALLAIIALITVPFVNKYIKNSREKAYNVEMATLKKAAQEWFTKYSSSVEWDEYDTYALNIDTLKQSEFLPDDPIYNPVNPSEEITGCIMIIKSDDGYTYTYSASCKINREYDFVYTGSLQTLTITDAGTYTIQAVGAGGTVGNHYNISSYTATPGLGASLTGTFTLKAGDVLYIVVGGTGTSTSGTATDGASGAGGGGSFVFKQISSISSSDYQFTKTSTNYETLIVAGGGGGTCDLSYSGSSCQGYSGIGATWYSPSNYTAFSTSSISPSSSSSNTNVLGITQFINYNLSGNTYTRGSSVCTGGYGGGACTDDSAAPGGGWSKYNNAATSFSSGTDTSGSTGTNAANGYVTIKRIG